MSTPQPVRVFVSNAPADDGFRAELETHLATLKRQDLIVSWSRDRLRAGDEVETEVSSQLQQADVILMLVSADYLASPLVQNVEMPRALERRRQGQARVVPILVRPVDLAGTELAGIQSLPRERKPVEKWSSRDSAWVSVIEGVRQVLDARPATPGAAVHRARSETGAASSPATSRSTPEGARDTGDSPAVLTWLHLSDLHFGQARGDGAQELDQQKVVAEILEDVATVKQRLGRPDLVIVTGDVAFSAKETEYDHAREWFVRLLGKLEIGPERLLIVPGNHDVARDQATGEYMRSLTHQSLRAGTAKLDDLLLPGNTASFKETLWPKLAAFARFTERLDVAPVLSPMSPFWTRRLETRWGVIRLVGLNTCLQSFDGADAPSNLALGIGQVDRLFRDLPQDELVLALMHHPLSWLSDGALLEAELHKRPHLLFSGHVHEADGRVVLAFQGSSGVRIDAGAGHAHVKEGRLHTYAWGRLVGTGFEYWPRVWNQTDRRFQPERNRFPDADGEGRVVLEIVKLPRKLEHWLRATGAATTGSTGAAGSGGAASGVTASGVAGPGVLGSGAAGPGVTASGVAGPGLTASLVAAFGAAGSGAGASSRDPSTATAPTRDPFSLDRWRCHLEYTRTRHAWIELLGIRRQDGAARVPLDQVYVELRADRSDAQRHPSPERVGRHGARGPGVAGVAGLEPLHPELDRTLRLHEALAKSRQAAMVGDPGSGKTTLLRYVARVVADGILGDGRALEKARTLLGMRAADPLPFPLFTTVSRLDAFLEERALAPAKVRATHVLGFLIDELERSGLRLELQELEGIIAAGRLLVLLDGLDEVPGHDARRRVARAVAELLAAHRPLRLVLTSRTRAFDPELANTLGTLDPYRLQPMSIEEVRRFLELWHAAVWKEEPAHGRAVSEALFLEIQGHPQVKRMADNPNVLPLIAILKHTRTKLPERRVELYREIIDLFLELKDGAREMEDPWEALLGFHLDLSEKRKLVAQLALEMHAGGEAGRVVPVKVPVMCFAKQLLNGRYCETEERALGLGERVLDVLELRSGLLRREGEGVQFAHLGYQEYLAAGAIAMRRSDAGIWDAVRDHVADDWWNEVIRLLASILEDGSGGLLERLAEVGSVAPVNWKARGRGVALAMGALQDLPPLHVSSTARAKVLGALDSLTGRESGARAADRIEALLALGQVGDPRLGMEKAERWVRVEPGTFWMGSKSSGADERPRHSVTIRYPFWIGRYPVTNQEYRAFVEAGGYQDAQWWSEEGWAWQTMDHGAFDAWFKGLREQQNWIKEEWKDNYRPGELPRFLKDDRFNAPNQPVVGVNWFEAEAYCRWLTKQLEGLDLVWSWEERFVRLPSEAEWEYVARGAGEREFPWAGPDGPDEERTNFDGKVGRTSPVGAYPHGATPDGVLDLAGNVWEWCADLWNADYKGAPADGSAWTSGDNSRRVLRGGSWNRTAVSLRAAYRGWDRSGDRDSFVGFRVVRPASRGVPY